MLLCCFVQFYIQKSLNGLGPRGAHAFCCFGRDAALNPHEGSGARAEEDHMSSPDVLVV